MNPTTHSTRTLSDFQLNPDKALAGLRRTGKPMLLTKNGEPEVMLIDVRKLYKKLNARQLEKLIEEAEADIIAGRFEDFDDFMIRFRNERQL